jgi:hypothetical protein
MGFGKNIEHKRLPNSQDILNCVTDLEIFEYYLGKIPTRAISSPLREDTKASFSLFHSERHGMILFKDFATGDVGDCFIFVMKLFNLAGKTDAFNRVASDFHLNQFEINPTVVNSLPKRRKLKASIDAFKKGKFKISVTIRNWKIRDKNYWHGRYGLNKAQLEYCNIFPISHYFINGYCTKADNLAYAFVEEKDGKQTFKIYQPFSDTKKWINNNDFSTWELWTQMPASGEVLIITSSRKDAMVIKSLFPSKKITSCALQSEGVKPKQVVIDELKRRFKRIYVMYDNDFKNPNNPGRAAGAKFAKQTGFKQIEIPDGCEVKDPSDYRSTFDAPALINLITNLINNN